MTAGNHNARQTGSALDARLAEVLAAYGRNPLRWPEADRVRFANRFTLFLTFVVLVIELGFGFFA